VGQNERKVMDCQTETLGDHLDVCSSCAPAFDGSCAELADPKNFISLL